MNSFVAAAVVLVYAGITCSGGPQVETNVEITPTPPQPFVQGDITIVPPVKVLPDIVVVQLTNGNGQPDVTIINGSAGQLKDGGTRSRRIKDATGREFEIYLPHRIDMPEGEIYLNAYPGEPDSVRVLHPQDFRTKIGDLPTVCITNVVSRQQWEEIFSGTKAPSSLPGRPKGSQPTRGETNERPAESASGHTSGN
jgi:hypothetical protein